MVASLECPPAVYVAAGARSRLPALARSRAGRVLVVTGQRSLRATGRADEIARSLSGMEVAIAAAPAGEPTVESVDRMRASWASFAPDLIVGAGGGSVLDMAKALAGLLRSTHPTLDYLEGIGSGREIEPPVVPWIALPTTAGTGSEATKNAVIKSAAHRVKKSLRSPLLLPVAAIVDPELAVGMPPRLTGESGLDALTQLVEAYVTAKPNPIARALIRDAFPRMLRALQVVAERPDDLDARGDAGYGALVSGIALANSGLGAVHGFASGLGGAADIPHGLICASFLAPVLAANRPAIDAGIGELMGPLALAGDPVSALIRDVEGLLARFGLAGAIRGYGIGAGQIAEIARLSEGSSMSGNPVRLSQEQKVTILQQVLLS